jgi:hypothetical protein
MQTLRIHYMPVAPQTVLEMLYTGFFRPFELPSIILYIKIFYLI